MKPRIRYFGQVWSCASWRAKEGALFGFELVLGCGYSPKDAWDEWLAESWRVR